MIQYPGFWACLFLGATVYWLLPERLRTAFLMVLSFLFVIALEWQTALMMAGISGAIYGILRSGADERAKSGAVTAAIGVLIGYLAIYKYLPAVNRAFDLQNFVTDLLLPLGISYFTFKLIHYAIEKGRGNLPEHGFVDYLAYVFLFPIFSAGPIERFEHFIGQRSSTFSSEHVVEGLTRIAHGLIKKFVFGAIVIVLINRLTDDGGVSYILANLSEVAFYEVIAFLLLSCLFIYMDFSGYTDIAIGSSRLFGLRIMENFNYPFLAPNIGNLWKRWHMTLANFCQTYVYMPMIGLTRNPYIAVMCSFFIMGLWHAASLNWIAWGLYNALGVMVFQTWAAFVRRRKWKFVKKRPYTWLGAPVTVLYFSGSFAFTVTDQGGGLYAGFSLLAKCFGITLSG